MLNTPYESLLDPLTTEEFDALKADIELNGVRNPVVVDEHGNILDGHHRYMISQDAPTCEVTGLTEAEKKAFVFRSNNARRNISPTNKKAYRKRMKPIAKELLEEGKSQKEVGALLGVARNTISTWFNINNVNDDNAYTVPDSRVKIPKEHHQIIFERIESGESQIQVAVDYGVTQPSISNIIKKQAKVKEQEKAAEEIKELGFLNVSLKHGDMRELSAEIPDDSIDLILTDPPYPIKFIDCWSDLASMAVRVLKPSAFLVAYSGQLNLIEVVTRLNIEGLHYYWTMCLNHGGTKQLINARGIFCGWKPLLVFQKDPFKKIDVNFDDVIAGTGREKGQHEWQQAVDELKCVIETFSKPGGMILDPFAGSGTTLLAASKNNRYSQGYEIDEKHYRIAVNRINNELQK